MRYPAKQEGGGIELVDGLEIARGTDGKLGSGVYSIDQTGKVLG
jgi:hypothetical protein